MSQLSDETIKRITESIVHNLANGHISSPPRKQEIFHLIGNAFGDVRADYLVNRDTELLSAIVAGLTVLHDLAGLNVEFDEKSGKFTADNNYSY